MRIARVRWGRKATFAVGHDNGWVPLPALGLAAETTPEMICQAGAVRARLPTVAPASVVRGCSLEAPIVSSGKIIGVGLNYHDHIREMGLPIPTIPSLFAKFPNSVSGPGGTIIVDGAVALDCDYEAELAVVIGTTLRHASPAQALAGIFGYAVANDITSRYWQGRATQTTWSKSFDTFCPIGPWITTADEVVDPQDLRIRCHVNGDLRQDGTTADMVFSVVSLLTFISSGMTLEAGDVILTGTPKGVGHGLDPPTYLGDGDVVSVEIAALGILENRVVASDDAANPPPRPTRPE